MNEVKVALGSLTLAVLIATYLCWIVQRWQWA